MELRPYNISVHVFFPSNIKTPGYAEENLTKPAEAKALDESAPTVTAEEAAKYCFRVRCIQIHESSYLF